MVVTEFRKPKISFNKIINRKIDIKLDEFMWKTIEKPIDSYLTFRSLTFETWEIEE